MSQLEEKLGIIAGGGGLPSDVARAAIADGREVYLLGIYGEAEEEISHFSPQLV